ncbi:DUF1330 domain-containing protein [Nocardioides endophyticus]|uniref:DUF1330 domain-containing protein n=1 Tax=Nocardioides endophyticus TaxID=1353775 RepID=A0ABP8YDL2_9ACTN
MTGYVLFDVQNVLDEEAFKNYESQVVATTAQFDGVYRVVSGDARALEGSWDPRFVVLIEFPSREKAEEWYGSEAYAPLKKIRQSSADCIGVIFSGVGG